MSEKLEPRVLTALSEAMKECSCCRTDLMALGSRPWVNETLAMNGFEHLLCESCMSYLLRTDERLVNLILLQLALAETDPDKLMKILNGRRAFSVGNRKEP